jgi:hypothetical protein
MGFDDDTHGRACPLPLTTYRQNFETMAVEAVRLLRDRIRNPDGSSLTIRVGGEIIERQSAAPPPNDLLQRSAGGHPASSTSGHEARELMALQLSGHDTQSRPLHARSTTSSTAK